MSSIICYLLCHPDVYERLRDELDHAFPYLDADGVPVIEPEKLSSLNLLNAVM
jgi:cytochrome P450